ncbi:EAL domain-containing protein [Thioalkalivibrio thiocyanodenitrificans]|uniref:EAL domain-containing protein n=1 Tax=Thioalkalivibrio thiocyanodenitrificans TaxID=243063 RepID=UPI00037390A4|nr:EAL domain-containing protein [Thioalkalivibrio thiocyanodenitrificans]
MALINKGMGPGMHRIVVVEESTTLRYILCRGLERHGFEAVAFDSPAAALARLTDTAGTSDVDGVLLGWSAVPGESAHPLLACLNQPDYAHLAVVLLTQELADPLVRWVQERRLSALVPWDDHHEVGGTLALMLNPATVAPARPDRGIRILLVDDSPSVRFFYHRLLSREGYQVESCADPGSAFELATRDHFDLAVVDHFMPGENGDRLCARLRADPRTAHMELAVLTGVYNDEVIRNCLEAGAVECLFKNEAENLFLARIGALWRSILAHKEVEAGRSRLEAILTSAGDGIYGVDTEGRITFINPTACSILGISGPEEVMGQSAHMLFHAVNRQGRPVPPERCPLSRAYARGDTLGSWEAVFRHRSGRLIPVEGSIQPLVESYRDRGSVVAFQDISERNAMEAQLHWQAEHDELTGLYNRRYLERALEAEHARCQATGLQSAVLVLDLDRFKYVNDTAGHLVGNTLLVDVSRRLRAHLGEELVLARLGGDEFALILPQTDAEGLNRVSEALRRLLHETVFRVDERNYRLNISIGAAWLGRGSETPADVLANADIACHVAKQAGSNQFHVCEPEQDVRAFMGRDLAYVEQLREALERDTFVLQFQPILAVAGGGGRRPREQYETLIRLKGSNGGLILPGEFIPVAERFGLIPEIDARVVARALRELRALHADGRNVVLNVNLSGRTLGDPGTLKRIQDMVRATTVDRTCLVFEITETSAILNLSAAREFIDTLRTLGVRFALDDFGTGFCSLSHLKQLPVDIVKFDGQFVRDLHRDESDRTMVSAMNDIVHAMGLISVAEFVECDEVLQILRGIGVDHVQGHYLGLPADEPRPVTFPEPAPALTGFEGLPQDRLH